MLPVGLYAGCSLKFCFLYHVVLLNHLVLSPETLKYWVGVQWGQSYLVGEGASLALVGHPSSDGVILKMPYGLGVLHQPALHPIFSYWVG